MSPQSCPLPNTVHHQWPTALSKGGVTTQFVCRAELWKQTRQRWPTWKTTRPIIPKNCKSCGGQRIGLILIVKYRCCHNWPFVSFRLQSRPKMCKRHLEAVACRPFVTMQSSLCEKVLVRRFVWQNRHSNNLVWNEMLAISCYCDLIFFFFNVRFSAVSCSLVPVRATKPFNDVESCLLQEEICGGRGYTGKPSWIFTKSNTFFFFFTIWLEAQWRWVIVSLHSHLLCRQRQRFYVFGLGSLLRKENLLDKQYNSRGLFSRKKKKKLKWAKWLKLTQRLSPSVTANLPFGKTVPVNVTLTTLKVVYHTMLYTAFKYSNGTMLFEA